MDTTDEFTGPVNIGNPMEVSVRELAEKIIAMTGSKSLIKHLPHAQDDPQRRCPDISLASRELGWQPRISLEEGLSRTIDYFRKVL
jgi:UDP-glucuronate decarboxylase